MSLTGAVPVVYAVAIALWVVTVVCLGAVAGERAVTWWVDLARELDPTRAPEHAATFASVMDQAHP